MNCKHNPPKQKLPVQYVSIPKKDMFGRKRIKDDKLRFGIGNAKLSKAIATFSLPAGWTCPFAKECYSKSNRLTGKILDGKHCKFRCFAASQECFQPSVRQQRWHNIDKLKEAKTLEAMTNLIQKSIPYGITMIRIHVSGDFWSEQYFLAWVNVAYNNPMITFYGYTKATPFLVKYKKYLPPNFRFAASKGGTCDNLIGKHRLKFAEVVFSTEEARRKGLEIDHDDSHCFNGSKESFALLLHGTQPPNTEASRAWSALQKLGIGGYGSSDNSRNIVYERPVSLYVTLKDGEIHLPQKVKQYKFIPNARKKIGFH